MLNYHLLRFSRSSPAPPLAPEILASAQADILEDAFIESKGGNMENQDSGFGTPPASTSITSAPWAIPVNADNRAPSSSQAPPSFSDLVKRSTRFITSVPAPDVLRKLVKNNSLNSDHDNYLFLL